MATRVSFAKGFDYLAEEWKSIPGWKDTELVTAGDSDKDSVKFFSLSKRLWSAALELTEKSDPEGPETGGFRFLFDQVTEYLEAKGILDLGRIPTEMTIVILRDIHQQWTSLSVNDASPFLAINVGDTNVYTRGIATEADFFVLPPGAGVWLARKSDGAANAPSWRPDPNDASALLLAI